MSKLEKLNIKQLRKQLFQEVVYRNSILCYWKKTTLRKLATLLNLDLQETKSIYEQKNNLKNITLDEALEETLMQKLLLELGFDFEKKNFDHFYEYVQFFGFQHKEPQIYERSLVVTVMGHVDHGKTTLLDVIRNSDIAHKERGKITQKIGGYQVTFQNKKITFIDTPGHKLFNDIRMQGTQITDLVVLVVAANEGIKEQTIEAIKHAQDSKVPIVVFINKTDLKNINPENVIKQLSKYNLTQKKLNGNTPYVQGSCLQKTGIKELLNTIVEERKKIDLKVDLNLLPKAVVIDSYLDKQGVKTSIIIQSGILKIKQPIIVDDVAGKIRSINNDLKTSPQDAMPGECVVILGLNKLVSTGSILWSFPNEKLTINLAKYMTKEKNLIKNTGEKSQKKLLDDIDFFLQAKTKKEKINLIIKVDSKSTEQILQKQLSSFAVDESNDDLLELNFFLISFGDINLNDVKLAMATQSQILTFNLKTNKLIAEKIKTNHIIYRNFYLLYELFEYLEVLQKKKQQGKRNIEVLGTAQVLKVFQHSKLGVIAGCVVQKGNFKINVGKIQVMRNEKIIASNLKIKSLKQEQNIIQGANVNQEFGIICFNFNNFEVGDHLQQYNELTVSKNEK